MLSPEDFQPEAMGLNSSDVIFETWKNINSKLSENQSVREKYLEIRKHLYELLAIATDSELIKMAKYDKAHGSQAELWEILQSYWFQRDLWQCQLNRPAQARGSKHVEKHSKSFFMQLAQAEEAGTGSGVLKKFEDDFKNSKDGKK